MVEGTLTPLRSNHPKDKKYLFQGRLNGAFTLQVSLEEEELGDLGEYVASGSFGAKLGSPPLFLQRGSEQQGTWVCLGDAKTAVTKVTQAGLSFAETQRLVG